MVKFGLKKLVRFMIILRAGSLGMKKAEKGPYKNSSFIFELNIIDLF